MPLEPDAGWWEPWKLLVFLNQVPEQTWGTAILHKIPSELF